MRTVIDELVTILGVDVEGGTLPKIQGFSNALDKVIKYAGFVSASLMTAATSMMYFAERQAHGAGELYKTSSLIGVNSKALQGWMFAAEAAGGSADSLKSDLSSLARSMSSPIPGEFNHALFMLGVSVRRANGELKSADELLMDLADKFRGMSDVEQIQWASRIGISDDTLLLLKRGRGEISAFLKQAADIPTIVDDDQLHNAHEFVIQLALVRRILTYIGQAASSAAGPAMKKVVETFMDWLKANREFIQLGLQNVIDGITAGFERFWAVVMRVKKVIEEQIPWIGKLVRGLTDLDVVAAVVFGSLTVLVGTLAVMGAKFVAIAAAVTAVALVFEDFMTYLEGGSSAIGDLVDWVGKLYKEFTDKFPGISGLLKTLGSVFSWLGGIITKSFVQTLQVAWTIVKGIASAIGGVAELLISLVDKSLQLMGFNANGFDLSKSGSDQSPWWKPRKAWEGAFNQATAPQAPAGQKPVGPYRQNSISIKQEIHGSNALGIANESARKIDTTLQQLFPGGLTPVTE